MSKSLTILVLILFFSCNRKEKNTDDKSSKVGHTELRTEERNYTIMEYKTEWWWIFKNAEPAELNSIELKKVDSLINIAVTENNDKRQHFVDVVNSHLERKGMEKTGFELDLKRYKRQYVTVLNESGEKEVWINFFCSHNENFDWEKELVIVADGGNCYFNLKVNLTTGEFYDLRINGVA